MLRLLIIAPGCNPDDVGESWVAYQWVTRLAERHEVTLLTYHRRDRLPPSHYLTGVRVVEWPDLPGVGRAERLNSLMKPGYPLFYSRARRWTRRALSRGEGFDLAFQPVPVAMRYPCPVAGLEIPYVVGPVGGSLTSPSEFRREEGSTAWYVDLRSFDAFRLRRDPLLRRSFRQAACVLGIAPYVAQSLADVGVARLELMSETGIDELAEATDRSGREGPVRLLYVGRLIRTKGARDAIRAMARLEGLPVVLDLVGDGFDRAECEDLVSRLGLQERVRFHGWVARQETARHYRNADVFFFPSYREPGGNVAFEAMSHGLPLVVSDVGGPGQVVDDSCGFRVPAVSPEQYASDLAEAVRTLVENPQLRLSMGAAARRRVAEIALWDAKVGHLDCLFDELLGRPVPRP